MLRLLKISVYIFAFFLVFTAGCKQEDNKSNQLPSNWSGYRPETIPYRVRKQNFEKGNLVPNSSFEAGRTYDIESVQDPFNAPGWSRSGRNVFWVNINTTDFDSTEVSSGIHAIKIHRAKSDETDDTGEGVISDFIKVIPGRYSLSLDIRLENIRSSKARLGTKLYDAIDIRLIYYDKNKIEISPNRYSEHLQTNINTSYKWLSFAHFTEIDTLGWTHVFCESAYPPFPDGYIPDDTRFIKVFLGLKGAGTMWVDNIEYKYTPDNFTLKERLQPLFTEELDPYDLLLPTPKELEKKGTIELDIDSLNKNNILIVHSKDMAPGNSLEFSNLVNRLEKFGVITKNNLTIKDINQYKLIFSIGATNIFKKTFNDSLLAQIKKNKEQGYIINSTEKLPNIIFVSSPSQQGMGYALNTLSQLIDTTKNIFFNADIVDWPEIKIRKVFVNSGMPDKPLSDCNLYTRMSFSSKNTENEKYWSGTSPYSPSIDNLDFLYYSKYNSPTSALYLDLPCRPYEVPINANNLLSMPDYNISGIVFENINELNVEIDSISPLNKLKLIAMSCYGWNATKYDVEGCIYKILTKTLANEIDRLKLITLSDMLNELEWDMFLKNEGTNIGNYEELISGLRFEDQKLDSVIRNSVKNFYDEISY